MQVCRLLPVAALCAAAAAAPALRTLAGGGHLGRAAWPVYGFGAGPQRIADHYPLSSLNYRGTTGFGYTGAQGGYLPATPIRVDPATGNVVISDASGIPVYDFLDTAYRQIPVRPQLNAAGASGILTDAAANAANVYGGLPSRDELDRRAEAAEDLLLSVARAAGNRLTRGAVGSRLGAELTDRLGGALERLDEREALLDLVAPTAPPTSTSTGYPALVVGIPRRTPSV